MRPVSLLLHLDLPDDWTDHDVERYPLAAIKAAHMADAEVLPADRPGEVHWPEDIPEATELDENVPNLLRPSLRARARISGWPV